MTKALIANARTQAVDFMVRLEAANGAAQATAQAALQQWLAAAPEHRQAWQELQRLQHRFAQAREVAARTPGQSAQAHRLLDRPGRRVVLRSLAGLAVGAVFAAGWADRQFPLRELGADLRTATAQRQRFALGDGSSVLLDARSALDVGFTADVRGLVLRSGRMLLAAAADPRPVWVRALHTQLHLLRGELVVEQDDQATTVAALADHVLLQGPGGQRLQLVAGQVAQVQANGVQLLQQSAAAMAAWASGQLVLDDVPLGQLVERLRPYRRGYLRVSPEAAALRVQGVFPLDDSERSLAAVAETLPVSLRHYGPVTLIDRR